VTADEARALALALPDAVEADHHGRPSFRVGGRIFATLWTPAVMNVMLDEPEILAAAQAHAFCGERWWGKRLSAVAVDLPAAEEAVLRELLQEAWARRR
jgi:hypothetical protein